MLVARFRAFTACVEIKFYGSFARWRGDVGSSPQRSQRGHVVAEKGLREELSGAPDALVDFRSVHRCRSRPPPSRAGHTPVPQLLSSI